MPRRRWAEPPRRGSGVGSLAVWCFARDGAAREHVRRQRAVRFMMPVLVFLAGAADVVIAPLHPDVTVVADEAALAQLGQVEFL